MFQKARTAKVSETLEVFADAGYFSGKKIVACESDDLRLRKKLTYAA